MDIPFNWLLELLDEQMTAQAEGRGLAIVLLVAFLLGLRHATDPDHLVAVTTLVAGTAERGRRAAALLGAAWGAGHAATLLLFGLPFVVLQVQLPGALEQAAEAAIGLIIVGLAVRLLVRWRRGAFHAHEHAHDGERHAHVHAHAESEAHAHDHPVRGARQSFALGTMHGLAGSGAVTVLLLAAMPRGTAAAALLVLAAGTALSMALLSAGFGSLLGAASARRTFRTLIPALGSLALVFGAWYTAGVILSS
jgi:ABC-type nickel/cobalt efflux system permease component RcnA